MWQHGFLGYDSSFMLDFVVTALVLVVPVLAYSISTVKRRQYTLHRNLQTALGIVLLVTVGAFEVDLQLIHGGWEHVVNKDPALPRLSGDELDRVQWMLWVHLVFAISTPLLWVTTLWLAWRQMPSPPTPCSHSPLHRRLGWASVFDLVMTSITGLLFYYAAFINR